MASDDRGTLAEALFSPFSILRRLFGGGTPQGQIRHTALDQRDADRQQEESGYNVANHLYNDDRILNRVQKYAISEEMDNDPLVSAILDALVSDATQVGVATNRVIWVDSANPDIKLILERMFDRLDMERISAPIIRNIAKFGDHFEGLILESNSGILGLRPYHPADVARLHGPFNDLVGYCPAMENGDPSVALEHDGLRPQTVNTTNVQSTRVVDEITASYGVTHFRTTGRDRRSRYGESILAGSRDNWRRLMMVEDQVVIQRLLRAPDRLLITLSAAGMAYDQIAKVTKDLESKFYKQVKFNPGSNQYISHSGLFAEHKDVVLPLPENNNTGIQNFPATNQNDLLRDLTHFMNRFLSGLGIPLGFFGFDGAFEPTRSLSAQDVRFAKNVIQLQRSFIEGVRWMCYVQLAYQGINPSEEHNHFTLEMQPPSNYMELERSELLSARAALANDYVGLGTSLKLDNAVWVPHVLAEYAKLPPVLIESLTESIEQDAEQDGEFDGFEAKVKQNNPKRSFSHTLYPQTSATLSKSLFESVSARPKESSQELVESLVDDSAGYKGFSAHLDKLREDRTQALRMISRNVLDVAPK